jgi:hypothetical protein
MAKAWTAVVVALKATFVFCILGAVWMLSGVYHERNFGQIADKMVRVRVRAECVRPDWVKTETDAREFDLTMEEFDIVTEKVKLLSKKTGDLVDKAEMLEELRRDMQTRSRIPMSGMGGPGPAPRKRD